jgi:hypothetical protein
VTPGGAALLGHWAFLPTARVGSLGAVRVRIFWPLLADGDVEARTAWSAGTGFGQVLVRDLYQDNRRAVQEHWWPVGAVPADLIPGEPAESAVPRSLRAGARLAKALAGGSPDDGSPDRVATALMGGLLAALDTALHGCTRPVISVAASFDGEPADLQACVVRISASTEGRIHLHVESSPGRQVLRAAVWFGCGSARRPPAAC